MPSITIYPSASPRWGNDAFDQTSDFKVGRSGSGTYYGYIPFPALNPAWAIKSVILRMNRKDTYSAHTLQLGSSASNAWGAKGTQDWKSNFSYSTGTGSKSVTLTAFKDILRGYAGTWYLHVQHPGGGANTYTEFSGGTSGNAPRLIIEYEDSSVAVPGDEFTIGVLSSMTVGNAGSGLTHNLSYSIGEASGVIATGVTAGASVDWTPPASLANQITTDMVDDLTLSLENYSGGVLQSTLVLTFPLRVPASFLPTISAAVFALKNPAGDDIGVYVQNRSWTQCTVTAASVYGATIVEYRVTIGGATKTSASNVVTTDVLALAGVLDGAVVVVDSRGQTASLTISGAVTVYEYFAPTVTSYTLLRCDAAGNATNIGAYIKYVLDVRFAPLNNLNSKGGTVAFKEDGEEEYGTPVALSAISAYSATVQGVIGAGAISAAAYMVAVTLQDRYTPVTVEASLPSSKIWFDLHFSGEGMAIGKAATEASLFDVGIAANFDKPAHFMGGVFGIGCVMARTAASFLAASGNAWTNIPFDTSIVLGAGLSYSAGGIAVDSGVQYVEVCLSLESLGSAANKSGGLQLNVNGGEVAASFFHKMAAAGAYQGFAINPIILAVAAGDKITARFRYADTSGQWGYARMIARVVG